MTSGRRKPRSPIATPISWPLSIALTMTPSSAFSATRNAIAMSSTTKTYRSFRHLSDRRRLNDGMVNRRWASQKTNDRKNLPPLPPSSYSSSSAGQSSSTPKLSPAQAKQQYLESQRRTEEFLKDPQGKMTQLQHELDEIKAKALEKLEREVYNKPLWQRWTDRIKRKQHSFINMVAATLAYVLAYNLHLKSKAHKEAIRQLDEEREKIHELQLCLRSLTDEETINEIATKSMDLAAGIMSSDGSHGRRVTTVDNLSRWGWWRGSPTTQTTSSSSSSATTAGINDDENNNNTGKERLMAALQSVLDDRIGDLGLDDKSQKEKNMQKIWKNNEEQLEQSKSQSQLQQSAVRNEGEEKEVGDEDDILALPNKILLPSSPTEQQQQYQEITEGDPEGSTPTAAARRKPRRVLDM
jgi:hypothetical protein